jgi:exopolyphosphatase/guanosine-5'-triphosphate,3'-diphosphate pyrophosphatase
MKICVIDVGTNSIHAVFAEIHATGDFRVLGREKEMVRLGDGAMISGKLTKNNMDAGLAAIKRFLHLAKHRAVVKTLAVATSAVRESSNGGFFLDKIRAETGLKIRVITGFEEARLIGLAVGKSQDFGGKKRLILDIGGGSAELIISDGRSQFFLESFKLGANRLSQLFPLSDSPKVDELERVEAFVKGILDPLRDSLRAMNPASLIGTSGTLLNLHAMTRLKTFDFLENVSYENLRKLYRELAALSITERNKRKGLDTKRADMILHGFIVLLAVMKMANIKTLSVCDKGLREGLLYDFVDKNRKMLQIEDEIEDIRRRSVMTLLHTCRADKLHAEQTAKLSLQIFDALKSIHRLGALDRELLESAALLHDIGYHISFDKHHKHSFYLINNAEMNGFSSDEIEVIAWTARFHRRGLPKKSSGDFGGLPALKQKRICQMASLLRLADALDHSHFSLVTHLKTTADKTGVLITVITSADIQWEIHEANQRKDLFERTYGLPISFAIRKTHRQRTAA